MPGSEDGSHGFAHVVRVWRNVRIIQAIEGGNAASLVAAAILHDCIPVEKDSPLRRQASRLAAEHAKGLLEREGWERSAVAVVCHAIEAHSFSGGVEPQTLEAGILQDADRLDAIGAIGIARCFHIGGRMGSALYDLADPDALNRHHDDARFVLDHFHTKLLKLASGFKTATGARMARERHERVLRFVGDFRDEMGDSVIGKDACEPTLP